MPTGRPVIYRPNKCNKKQRGIKGGFQMSTNIYFDYKYHEFSFKNKDADNFYSCIKSPLSMIVQVTRKCNLNCSFCSESDTIKSPSLKILENLKNKLQGVERIYLSGGEPLLRNDLFEIIDMYRPNFKILGLPTNCTKISKRVCERLIGKIDYLNAGLDGPRYVNNIVRGNYDDIIKGLYNLKDSGIGVSLSTVILQSTLEYLKYVVQIADTLGIVKVKMAIPVHRGRAKNLSEKDYVENEKIIRYFLEIKELKEKLGWKPRIKFTFWNKKTEGYALLVYPNQKVYAWPVFDKPDSVSFIGDLNNESLEDIWLKYPYKINHIEKYTGISMYKI